MAPPLRGDAVTALVGFVAALGLLGGCGAEAGEPGSDPTTRQRSEATEPTPTVDLCTQVGCSSRVVVDLLGLPGGFDQQAVVCIDAACTDARYLAGADIVEHAPDKTFPDSWTSGGKPTVSGPAPDSHVTTVRITVRDSAGSTLFDGAIIAPLTANQPNGANCPPTCWYVRVAFDPSTGHLGAFDGSGRSVAAG